MNFRTTIILILLLAAAGLVVFVTRDKSASDQAAPALTQTNTADSGEKVVELSSSAIDSIHITPADDKAILMKRTNAAWTLEEPVKAPADAAVVARLLDGLTELRSKGTITGSNASADASITGLDHPKYKIELSTTEGKSLTLNIGERAATGDNLYLQKSGDKAITLVSADVYEQLEKPSTAYRRARIFDTAATSVNALTITSSTPTTVPSSPQTIELQKPANDWKMIEPKPLPAETSAVSDLLFAITGIKAEEFVAEKVDDMHRRRLDEPQLMISFLLNKPSTQPTSAPATPETPTTIKFGGYTDVTRKFVYATASNSPALFTVAVTTLDLIRKSPNDLRDRRVATIDPQRVSKLNVTVDENATTQPTTREASHSVLTIQRAPKTAATAPATSLSSQPSSQPSTAPATKPAAMWEVVRTIAEPTAAVDATVSLLLNQLNPLRVVKYTDEQSPTSQPASGKMLTLTIETIANGGSSDTFEIKLRDPGHGEPVTGSYNGTSFEVDRALFDAASADFTKPPVGGMPTQGMQGMPPGMPTNPK